jgi:hypothetical protein
VAVAFTVPATAAQVTESFDTAASASAHGWVADGGTGSGLGFSNTSEAGGAPGEGRALVSGPGSDGSYLDRTIGGTFTSSEPFMFEGKLDVLQTMPGLQNVAIGYHFGSRFRGDVLGLLFTDGATAPQMTWGIVGVAPRTPGGSGAVFARAGSDLTRVVAPGDRTFSFAYDPQGGDGSGRIVASVSGAGDPLTLDLTPANRALFDNAELNAFGVFYGLFDPATTHLADYRFDDVSYTVLPEPATGLALLPLAFPVRRRRGTAERLP